MKKITIAIDGHSSCGKSTMAKDLAREVGYVYVDTGAMYRSVTLYALRNGLFRDDDSIDTGSIPIQGTDLSEALMASARSFSTQSTHSRAIVLITDGEDHEGQAVETARTIAEQGIRIYCIGVGSPQGKPIPKDGSLMKDASGDIVVSRLNEEILQEIAGAGNGKYVRAGAAEFGLNPIIDDIRTIDKEQFNSVVFEDFDEQYMYFFAIALFFLILELLVPERKARRRLFKN